MTALVKFKKKKKNKKEEKVLQTISFKVFLHFFMLYQIFLSSQVERWTIITYKDGIYELPHEMTSNLRLGCHEIRKYQESI